MFAVRPMFSGLSYVSILPGGSVDDLQVSPTDARVRIIVKRDGTIEFRNTGLLTLIGSHNWVNGGDSTVGDTHWVRFTQISGNTPNDGSSALNTWLQLNADRYIGYLNTTNGNSILSGQFNIEIATDSSGADIVCSTGTTKYLMTAEVSL